MYGLTEAFRSTYLPPEEVDRRPDSIGKAIPNAEILVLREDGTPCAPTSPASSCTAARSSRWATGTIRRRRPSATGRCPGAKPGSSLPEIAVFSGDTVRMDEEGFLYFIGRRDEMIKTSGYRVSPTEVEEVLYATELVGEAAAFGVPHPTLGQAIVVVATPPAGEHARCRHAADGVPRAPAGLHGAGDDRHPAPGPLPRNPNGKIDRKALVRRLRRSREGLSAPQALRAIAAGPSPTIACVVGGMPLTRLAERVGRTPFYAYDRRADRRARRASCGGICRRRSSCTTR